MTLKTARKKQGITIKQAAEQMGIHRDTLSRWERGKTHPNVIQLKEIERVYKISYANIEFKQ